LILHWQQHPDTRRYSRNPVPPTRAKHEAWMARKLADFRSLLQIVMRDNAPAGFIRLDRGEHIDGYEVSIVTAPGQGRRGIGAAALKLARRLLPESTIRAFVMPENRISLRLFEKAGYKSVGDNWYVQHPTAMMAVTA
jgi:UDP-2,4-diacetamido-2,4,6-trideoxy-beta-L-altropyranose hydrolase